MAMRKYKTVYTEKSLGTNSKGIEIIEIEARDVEIPPVIKAHRINGELQIIWAFAKGGKPLYIKGMSDIQLFKCLMKIDLNEYWGHPWRLEFHPYIMEELKRRGLTLEQLNILYRQYNIPITYNYM